MAEVTNDERYRRLVATCIQFHGIHFAFDMERGSVPSGSGVLVRCGGVDGILTCAHVLEQAMKRAAYRTPGLISFVVGRATESSFQHIHMPLPEFAKCPMIIERGGNATKQEEELGPDLGFVRLPDLVMSSLGALGSILLLDKQAAMRRNPNEPVGTVETMTIVAGNLAEQATAAVGSKSVKVMLTTAVFSAEPQPIEAMQGYDRFVLDPGMQWQHPTSFGGLSGCGVWQLAVGRKGDDPIALETRLTGIVYFQTDPDERGYRRLIAHGPRSIYEKLLPKIEALGTQT